MSLNVTLDPNLWFTRPLPEDTGYTWTLASRLGHILREVQCLYGPRDQTYTPLGVEIGGAIPQIWYPGNCKHVIIQITPNCAADMARACYQMAHEAVHLLSPTGGAGTTVLEEGLATHFSARYMREHLNAPAWHATEPSYQNACRLTEELLALDSDVIRRVREIEPTLAYITFDHLRAVLPNIQAPLAAALVERFQR